MSPPDGIDELVDALDQRHRALDLPGHRLRGRRAAALAQFTVEYGERGLRALGGRRAASAWLQAQPAGLDAAALVAGLESRVQGRGGRTGDRRVGSMNAATARRIVLPAEPLVDGDTSLRPWRDDDLPALVESGRDPDVTRWMGLPGSTGSPTPAPT